MSFVTGRLWNLTRDSLATAGEPGGAYVVYETQGVDRGGEGGDRLAKARKTVSCVYGRVSVEPSEVIDRPGYLAARTAAASLTRVGGDSADSEWRALSDEDMTVLVSGHLLRARSAGMSVD